MQKEEPNPEEIEIRNDKFKFEIGWLFKTSNYMDTLAAMTIISNLSRFHNLERFCFNMPFTFFIRVKVDAIIISILI